MKCNLKDSLSPFLDQLCDGMKQHWERESEVTTMSNRFCLRNLQTVKAKLLEIMDLFRTLTNFKAGKVTTRRQILYFMIVWKTHRFYAPENEIMKSATPLW